MSKIIKLKATFKKDLFYEIDLKEEGFATAEEAKQACLDSLREEPEPFWDNDDEDISVEVVG